MSKKYIITNTPEGTYNVSNPIPIENFEKIEEEQTTVTAAGISGLDYITFSLTLSDDTVFESQFYPAIETIEDDLNGNSYYLRNGFNSETGASAGENVILGYYNTISYGWGNFVTGSYQQLAGSGHTLLGSNNKIEGNNTYNSIVSGAYNIARTMYTAIFGYNNKDRHPAVGGTMPYPDGGNLITGFNNYIDNGMSTAMFGSGHIQTGNNLTVVGQASINLNGAITAVNTATDARFIVGNGTIASSTYARGVASNAFVVYHSGLIVAPTLTPTLIDTQARSLVTREYLTSAIGSTAPSVHNHDDRYFTETESDARFAPIVHTHNYDNYQSWNLRTNGVQRTTITTGGILDIVAINKLAVTYSAGGVVTLNGEHNHDERYYTELESDDRFFNVTGDDVVGDSSFTGKTTYDGDVYYNTQNGLKGVYLSRYDQSAAEFVKMYLEDIVANFYYLNDERHARFKWTIDNTDTESNAGAQANLHTFEFLGNEFGAFLYLDGQEIIHAGNITNYQNFENPLTFVATGDATVSRTGDTITIGATAGTGGDGYLSGVTGSTNGTMTFTRSGLTDIVFNSAHTHSWTDITSKPTTFTPSAHTLDSHSNVTISLIGTGEILKWSGTAWINNTLAEAGISAIGHTHNYENPLTFTATGAATVSRVGNTVTIGATNTDTNTTYSAGTGLSLSGTTFTNTAPHIATNLSLSSTGTAGTIISSTGTNVLLPIASTAVAGLITNTTQTIGGAKTFTSNVSAPDFVGTSDRRLKKNIKTLIPKEIKSVYRTFEFKNNEQKRVGVVAQELEVNHPEFIRVNEEGIKSVSYTDLHSAEIAYLKDKINRLEALVNKLIE